MVMHLLFGHVCLLAIVLLLARFKFKLHVCKLSSVAGNELVQMRRKLFHMTSSALKNGKSSQISSSRTKLQGPT